MGPHGLPEAASDATRGGRAIVVSTTAPEFPSCTGRHRDVRRVRAAWLRAASDDLYGS